MKKSDKTELTVSKIIKAAINEFGRNGYSGGTINNICKTGINKGLLYHNFSGKDGLYLTRLNLSCKKLIHHIQEKSGAKNPITLRDTVAREDDAVSYFHMMQTMLNGYFSSPVFCNISLEEKMDLPGIICSTLVRAPELVQIVQGTIAAAAIINEFIAVIAAKKGFELAGEIHKA